MNASTGDLLCRALDLERKSLDYYLDARDRCSSDVARRVFDLLAEDKLRLATRLAEVQAALNQGMTLDRACVLTEDDILDKATANSAVGHSSQEGACSSELKILLLAIEAEGMCLNFFEEQLREATDRHVRFFLERALEEERGHFVLLSDMKYYFEESGNPAPR
jgi:rubrerythrin